MEHISKPVERVVKAATKQDYEAQCEEFVLDMTDRGKIVLLSKLLDWADSDAGCDYRAALAAGGEPSPVTAQDVIAILPPADILDEVDVCKNGREVIMTQEDVCEAFDLDPETTIRELAVADPSARFGG